MLLKTPSLVNGLVVNDKKQSVANYHAETLKNFLELCRAAGIDDYKQLNRGHIYRRVSMNEVKTFEDIFPSLNNGDIINGNIPERYSQDYKNAIVTVGKF